MHFDIPPPFAPGCDWAVNLTDCENELWHHGLGYAAIAIHLAVTMLGGFVLWRRRYFWRRSHQHDTPTNVSHRYIARPVDGMVACFSAFLMTRTIYILICLLDVAPKLAIREPLSSLSFVCGYFGTLLFTAGVIETVSPVLANLQETRWQAPPYQMVLGGLGVLATTVPPITSATAWLAGQYGDRGEWSRYIFWNQITWFIWSFVMLLIAVVSACYFGALASLLRQQEYLFQQSTSAQAITANHTTPIPTAAMIKSTGCYINKPRSSSMSSCTINYHSNAMVARARTIRQLKRTLLLELILVATTAVSASIGAFTKRKILSNEAASGILEIYTLSYHASSTIESNRSRAIETAVTYSIHTRPSMARETNEYNNAAASASRSQLVSKTSRSSLRSTTRPLVSRGRSPTNLTELVEISSLDSTGAYFMAHSLSEHNASAMSNAVSVLSYHNEYSLEPLVNMVHQQILLITNEQPTK
ncbi:hypothetical protein BDF19DRAFT_426871 [Syncephalis fuscata]|nr:hypothetical protein BDF19DRAFT_426871 [Syncephalis fuscata]